QFGPSLPNTAELKAAVNVSVELTIDSDSAGPNATSCAADFTADASFSRPAREYTGSMMSTDLKGDLREFFRSIAAITGVQLDVDPTINGAVAVHLKNIPADLALDAVLSTSGLGSELDGKVLRIRTANPALGQDRVLMGTVTIVGTIAEVDIQNPRVQFHVNA